MGELKGWAAITKGLSEAPQEAQQQEEASGVAVATRTTKKTTRGKSSDPSYERLTVLVRKDTKKAATRLWEDVEPDQDLSDLLEQLLSTWVNGHINT